MKSRMISADCARSAGSKSSLAENLQSAAKQHAIEYAMLAHQIFGRRNLLFVPTGNLIELFSPTLALLRGGTSGEDRRRANTSDEAGARQADRVDKLALI